jgi:predicted site-specific integrase-resolvase
MRMHRMLLVAGLLVDWSVSVSAATTYTYDTLGRLRCVAYDNGNTIVYSYDPAGNRSQVVVQSSSCPSP